MNFTTDPEYCSMLAMTWKNNSGREFPYDCIALQKYLVYFAAQKAMKIATRFSIVFIVICIPMLLIQLTSLPVYEI
jgi:hypothetical protein